MERNVQMKVSCCTVLAWSLRSVVLCNVSVINKILLTKMSLLHLSYSKVYVKLQLILQIPTNELIQHTVNISNTFRLPRVVSKSKQHHELNKNKNFIYSTLTANPFKVVNIYNVNTHNKWYKYNSSYNLYKNIVNSKFYTMQN